MSEISVNKWSKSENMDRESIIRFQLLVHCHLSDIREPSVAEMQCLVTIGKRGMADLTELVEDLMEWKVFSSTQSARNSITELQKTGLVVKQYAKGTKKVIFLNPDMKIQTKGNILLDIKCLSREQLNQNNHNNETDSKESGQEE